MSKTQPARVYISGTSIKKINCGCFNQEKYVFFLFFRVFLLLLNVYWVEAERYHKTEVPVFTGSGPVSKRNWSCFKQEVLSFGNKSTFVSSREYFCLKTGVLSFQTGVL